MNESRPPGQAIVKAPNQQQTLVGERGLAIRSLGELMEFAELIVRDGAAPKGFTKASAALAIQAGLERGLGIMGGLQAVIVVNGVVSWRGWAAVGLIQNSKVCVPGTFRSWCEGEGDERVGYCRAQRVGYAEPFTRKFSVKDAKLAGLWNKDGPWRARPENMLEWRAIGDMGRFHFSDVLGGVPIDEDVLAGGIGPTSPQDMAAELPAAATPAPRTLVRDPILAALAPGSDDAVPLVEARLVEEAPVVANGESEKTAEVQKVIDTQVDEIFLPPGAGLVSICPRCKAKLNELRGCDVCGWPGPDNGERP